MQKLNVKAFSLAWGITCGLGFMLLGWVATSGWGLKMVTTMSSLYIGYAASFWGGILGGIWAFFDWGIGALIFVLFYNAMLPKSAKSEHHHDHHDDHEHHHE